jgi:hypothetical protein
MHELLHVAALVASLGVLGALAFLNVFVTLLLLTRHKAAAVTLAKKAWPFVKYFSLPENSREDLLRSKHFGA